MKAALDIEETLKLAWATFTEHPVEAIVGFLIVGFLSGLTLGLAAGPLFVGYNRMMLRAIRGGDISLGDVFGGFDAFVPSFVVVVVVGFAAAIGFLFLVLPGLAVIIFTWWALMLVADHELGAFEALQRSFEYTKDNFGPALVFVLVCLIISGAGTLVFAGSLITAPLAHIMALHGFTRAFGTDPAPAQSSSAAMAA